MNKIMGLSLAIMLGFSTVGCINIEVPNEQQQENQQQIQDEDVTDEYLKNKAPTNLEKGKEYVENWLEENNLNSFGVAIDEKNQRLYIVGKSDTEKVANWINNNEWNSLVEFGKKVTTKFNQELNTDIAFVIVTSDVEKCYLSVFNGEVMFNVEDELN